MFADFSLEKIVLNWQRYFLGAKKNNIYSVKLETF